jgi:hypothetical protein
MRKTAKREVGINSQPRSISEDFKCSRDNLYRTNGIFLVCIKKMLRAIGRAMLVVEWNDRKTGSVDFGHARVKINRRIDHKDIQLTYPRGIHQESLQRVEE